MKITIQFKVPDEIEVDLTKFGCSEQVEWEDLTDEKQRIVLASVKEQYPVKARIVKVYPTKHLK